MNKVVKNILVAALMLVGSASAQEGGWDNLSVAPTAWEEVTEMSGEQSAESEVESANQCADPGTGAPAWCGGCTPITECHTPPDVCKLVKAGCAVTRTICAEWGTSPTGKKVCLANEIICSVEDVFEVCKTPKPVCYKYCVH